MLAHAHHRLSGRLTDQLYVEAMLLADEARGYFESEGREDRDRLPPMLRVGFSCESLRVTTRLMHIIAWLLTHRAVVAGEISLDQARAPERRLGASAASDPSLVAALPEPARAIVAATADLYARVLRLDEADRRIEPAPSPARGLIERLAAAL